MALLVLLGAAGLTLAAAVLAVALFVHRLRRRNRVSPTQPSPAPVGWLWSPRVAARLHRRLRAAVAVARMIAMRHAADPDRPRTAELAAELEREAVAVDHHLALVGRLPAGQRKAMLARVVSDVHRIERVASRLSMLEVDAAAPARLASAPSAIEALSEELDRLEAARRELQAAEAQVGLRSDPSPPRLLPG